MNTYTFKLTATEETVVISARNFAEAMSKLRAQVAAK